MKGWSITLDWKEMIGKKARTASKSNINPRQRKRSFGWIMVVIQRWISNNAVSGGVFQWEMAEVGGCCRGVAVAGVSRLLSSYDMRVAR